MRSAHNGLVAALLSLAFLIGIPMDSAFARAPSSFQASCSQTTVVGNVLSSLCKTGGFLGGDNRSSLVLQGIYNDDGVLRDDGTNHSASFQESCKDIRLQEYLTAPGADLSKLPVALLATCRKRNGAWVPARIEIRGIYNEHGQLKYQMGNAAEQRPGIPGREGTSQPPAQSAAECIKIEGQASDIRGEERMGGPIPGPAIHYNLDVIVENRCGSPTIAPGSLMINVALACALVTPSDKGEHNFQRALPVLAAGQRIPVIDEPRFDQCIYLENGVPVATDPPLHVIISAKATAPTKNGPVTGTGFRTIF